MNTNGWRRRARPLLGTLVEIGVGAGASADAAADAGFATIVRVQACLSRFDPASDIARFHALPAGAGMAIDDHTRAVLEAAQALHDASDGLFDVSLGSAPRGWRCDDRRLWKLHAAARLDLGGIGKGHAVDQAVDALRRLGCEAGWVNAGGDLRVFGDIELPLALRDETGGGTREFGTLADERAAAGGRPCQRGGAARPVGRRADQSGCRKRRSDTPAAGALRRNGLAALMP